MWEYFYLGIGVGSLEREDTKTSISNHGRESTSLAHTCFRVCLRENSLKKKSFNISPSNYFLAYYVFFFFGGQYPNPSRNKDPRPYTCCLVH